MVIHRGFTLIELLITIAIMAIVAVIAAPSFSVLIAQQRLNQGASELASTLTQARSQAALKRAATAICLNKKAAGGDVTLDDCATSNIPNYSTLDATQKDAAKKTRTFLVEVPKGVAIKGANDFVVFQQTGTPVAAKTIALCQGGVQRNIGVSLTGSVSNIKGTC